MRTFRTILVPTDYSAHADDALGVAIGLAGEIKAHLCVIHVVPPYDPSYFQHVGASSEPGAHIELREQKRLADHVARFVGRKAVRCQTAVIWGDPAQRIIERATELGCDLIVMGRNGATAWDRLVMGSVAEKVVHLAPCPVLVARGATRATARRRMGSRRRARRQAA